MTVNFLGTDNIPSSIFYQQTPTPAHNLGEMDSYCPYRAQKQYYVQGIRTGPMIQLFSGQSIFLAYFKSNLSLTLESVGEVFQQGNITKTKNTDNK